MTKINQSIDAYTTKNKYNLDNELMLKEYPIRIVELLKEKNRTTTELSLLELGLGHGYSTLAFNSHFNKHVVIEGDKRIIQNFREKHSQCNVELIHSFFENYESSKKFDVIVLGFVLEHIEDPIAILRKFREFLTDDGLMFIAVPNAESLNRRIGYMAGLLSDLTELSKNDIQFGHRRYYTVKSINETCVNAGLNIKKMEGIFLKPITTAQIRQLDLSKEILHAFCRAGIEYPELSVALLAEVR